MSGMTGFSDTFKEKTMKKNKKYLIALEETRSIIALVSGIIIFVCTLASVLTMTVNLHDQGDSALHYFTALSNLFSAVGAAFMIPYAAEGIRKKRFVLPRRVVLFQYSGATCVAITLVTSCALILPTQGISQMSGPYFWLHIITPALTVLLFQSVESGVEFRKRDMIISLIPYWVYMAVYFIMVIVIGKENGGWEDFYMTTAYIPVWLSFILMMTMGFAISFVLYLIRNKSAKASRRRIAKAWSDDLEPKELLIEAFGLGRYIGSKCDVEELTVPLDVFLLMSQRYNIPVERLTKAYVKGALDSIEERQK